MTKTLDERGGLEWDAWDGGMQKAVTPFGNYIVGADASLASPGRQVMFFDTISAAKTAAAAHYRQFRTTGQPSHWIAPWEATEAMRSIASETLDADKGYGFWSEDLWRAMRSAYLAQKQEDGE